MAISVAVTNHTSTSGTPAPISQGYTGVGFVPKALMLMWAFASSVGSDVRSSWGFSAASGSSDYRHAYAFSDDNITPTAAVIENETNAFFKVTNLSGVPSAEDIATLTSFDSDGFTMNHTTITTLNRPFTSFALAGADLTNVATGKFGIGTATTSLPVTGVGFQPDCVLFFAAAASAADTVAPARANSTATFGFASGASNQGCVGTRIKDNVATSVSRGVLLSSSCYKFLTDAGGQGEGALTTFDSDGFTINRTEAGVADYRVYFLALKGGAYKVLNFTGSTTATTQQVTGAGFTPKAVLLLSGCKAPSSSNSAHAKRALGVAVSSSADWAGWFGDKDAVNPQDSSQRTSTSAAITICTEGGGATIVDQATLSTFDSDGFTLNWGTASGTGKDILALCIGDTVVSSSGTTSAASIASTLHPRAYGASATLLRS